VLLGIFGGTHWELGELFGNTLGTEKKSSNIPSLPLPPQKPKRKKNWALLSLCLSLLIGCMKIIFKKLFVNIFQVGFPKSLNSLQQHLNMSKVTLNFNWEHNNFFPRASQIGLGNCGCSLEG
jgi:hypothetical protein